MVSRNTIRNRQNDRDRLGGLLYASAIDATVAYDDARGRYVVTRDRDNVELISGRYEVVHAWIRGYLDGVADRASIAWSPS